MKKKISSIKKFESMKKFKSLRYNSCILETLTFFRKRKANLDLFFCLSQRCNKSKTPSVGDGLYCSYVIWDPRSRKREEKRKRKRKRKTKRKRMRKRIIIDVCRQKYFIRFFFSTRPGETLSKFLIIISSLSNRRLKKILHRF